MKTIISAPFGNYLQVPGCISTLGTYTLRYRGGWAYRLWRMLKTLRPFPGGWINQLGLPNPGIMHLVQRAERARPGDRYWIGDKIVSIHGFDQREWEELLRAVLCLTPIPLAIEFNISCPNVGSNRDLAAKVREVAEVHAFAMQARTWHCGAFPFFIYKLPPLRYDMLARHVMNVTRDQIVKLGVGDRRPLIGFHCCNTLGTPRGGISGKPLKPLSLCAIEELHDRWPDSDTYLIGGGGVTGPEDVDEYAAAGADAVAVGSYLLNPFLARARILGIRDHVNMKA